MIYPRLSHAIPGGRSYRPLLASARQFPADAAAWAAAFPSVTVPTSIWPCQDSGLPLVDTVSAIDLDTFNASGDEYLQVAGDPFGRYSLHVEDVASHVRSNTTDYDLDETTHLSGFMRFKFSVAPGNGQYLMRKKSSTANTNGWAVIVNSSGHVSLMVDTPGTTLAQADIAVNHADGLWHDYLFVVDRTAQLARIYSDLGSATADISAHTTITNGSIFGLGDTQGNLNACARGYYSYNVAWLDEKITSTEFDTIRGAA